MITGEGSRAEGAPEGAHIGVGRYVLAQVVFAAEYPTTHVTSIITIHNITLVYDGSSCQVNKCKCGWKKDESFCQNIWVLG